MPTVYIETSIVSYLRHNPGAPVELVLRQEMTRAWWDGDRARYELVTSQYVRDEAGMGDPVLAAERLSRLAGIPLAPLGPEIDVLATEIVARGILPAEAILDSLHIACVAVHRLDYLLTWNLKHIANPLILPRVFRVLDDFGLPFPVICTPRDLLDSTNVASFN